MDWLNLYGLITIVLMLVPNMVYACKNKEAINHCQSKTMIVIEQIGRYGSMFLMTFNIGIAELGFRSDNEFTIWLVSMGILLVLYWTFWGFYFKKPQLGIALLLAILPSAIFILSGLLLRHWLLVLFGLAFSVGHIYITWKNNQPEQT